MLVQSIKILPNPEALGASLHFNTIELLLKGEIVYTGERKHIGLTTDPQFMYPFSIYEPGMVADTAVVNLELCTYEGNVLQFIGGGKIYEWEMPVVENESYTLNLPMEPGEEPSEPSVSLNYWLLGGLAIVLIAMSRPSRRKR